MSAERTTDLTKWIPSFRKCLVCVTIGVVLGVVLNISHAIANADAETKYVLSTGLQSLRWVIVVVAVGICAYVFWLWWFRPSGRTLFTLHAVVLAMIVIACTMFRIEGFYGNLYPNIVWRWASSAEQEWDEFAQQIKVSTAGLPTEGLSVSPVPSGHDHPGYLGATRDGNVSGVRLASDWNSHPPREIWRHPVGLGWSGFAVVGRHAVTQEQRGTEETVVCYDLWTGQEIWTHSEPIRFSASHGDGPRATPMIAGGRVYAIGATGLLTCLDGATGEPIWQQETRKGAVNPELLWGVAGSPLIDGDCAIVSPGGGGGRSLLAYLCEDGSLVWSGGDDHGAYASPSIVTLAGRRLVLDFNGDGLRAHDASNGAPLWLHPWVTQARNRVNVAQPLVVAPFGSPASEEGFVLIASGYGMGATLLRVTTNDDDWHVEEVWRSRELEAKMSNFVVHDGHIYGLDNGVLVCVDLRDGHRVWKHGRYGHGQLLLVNDLLLVQVESGDVALVAATPAEHRELARQCFLSDKTWNHPALAGNVLVVRNDREAAAFELPVEGLRSDQLTSATRP